jgi:site-specific recombinase XerD
MPLDQFNRQTIHDLEIFFKADYNLSVNSTAKMLEFIRKGILWAYQCGLILINPFSAYRIKKEDTQVQFLNKQEISRIRKKQLDIPRLDLVRDSFVFSCFTGISYADMCKLTKDQIVFDSKSSGYIHFYRTKTNHPAFIPLLPQSMEILDKYINQNNSGKIFPMLSNQKTNAYLKELADICGIKKKLTYHVARHSFAVTICLENGIPIETLSKILGHTNLRVTQAYAKITHKKVMNDMQALKDRLEY